MPESRRLYRFGSEHPSTIGAPRDPLSRRLTADALGSERAEQTGGVAKCLPRAEHGFMPLLAVVDACVPSALRCPTRSGGRCRLTFGRGDDRSCCRTAALPPIYARANSASDTSRTGPPVTVRAIQRRPVDTWLPRTSSCGPLGQPDGRPSPKYTAIVGSPTCSPATAPAGWPSRLLG